MFDFWTTFEIRVVLHDVNPFVNVAQWIPLLFMPYMNQNTSAYFCVSLSSCSVRLEGFFNSNQFCSSVIESSRYSLTYKDSDIE